MVDTKPTTLWAVVSLVCSILGSFGALTLLALGQQYEAIAHRTAFCSRLIWRRSSITLAAVASRLIGQKAAVDDGPERVLPQPVAARSLFDKITPVAKQ